MAFGGRELRLILSIQSYGTTNIAKLRRDIAQLSTAAQAANARQMAQARLAQRAVAVSAAERELKNVRAGIPFYTARNKAMATWGRANSSVLSTQARLLDNERRLFDIETKRQLTQRRIQRAQVQALPVKDIEIMERQLQSLNMQEAVLNKNTQALNTQLSMQRTALLEADAAYKELVRTQGLETAATREAAAALEMKRVAYKQAQLAAVQMATAEKMAPVAQLEQTGRRIAHIGRTAQFAGLLMTAGFGLAAESAANFSQKLYLAATQARDLDAPISQTLTRAKQLEHGFDSAGVHIEGILDLMQQFPASADEMAQASYDIYSSMNVGFGQGLKLLKSFNQVAVATGGDLATATNAGITVLNNFGKTSGSVNDILNLMISTIRFGRMHLKEFNDMLGKVAPAASAAGQSFRDVAGAMALLTTRQPSQRVSSTGIARLLQTFQDPDFQRGVFNISKGLVDITKGRGAVGVLKPLPDIINDMARGFGLFQKYGGPQQLFKELTATGRGTGVGRQSRIEAWRAYTFLVKNLQDYNDLQRKTTSDTTEFAKALAVMSQAPGVRWQIFLNQMKAFVITVGEAALPALLQIADYLQRAAKWFSGLSEGTRKAIVQFGVFAGIALLVNGTLVNVIGSVIALVANLRAMRYMRLANLQMDLVAAGGAAETAQLKAGLLMRTLTTLTGIGIISIPIVVQLLRGGDPGLWGLLSAAGAGALGGFMIGGPAGAAIGALSIPLVVQIIAEFQKKDPVKEAYLAYLKKVESEKGFFQSALVKTMNFLEPVARVGGISIDPKENAAFQKWLHDHPKYLRMWRQEHASHNSKEKSLNDDYIANLKKFNKETVDQVLNLNKQLDAAWRAQDQTQTAAQQKAAQIQRARIQATQQAMQNMQQKISRAVDSLMSMYDQIEQENKQALGQLFGGPAMQGVFGQMFSSINADLRQFGIQIAVPFDLLQRDMSMQLGYFKRWRKDLNKLLARGAPLEFVNELKALGPEAGIPIAEGLLQGSKKGFNNLIKEWKRGQQLVRNVSKKDQQDQLKDWERYGKNIAWAIINGLISEPAQMHLRKGFRKYVVDTFGDVLHKQMANEIRKAVNQAMKEASVGQAATVGTKAATQKDVRTATKAAAKIPIRDLSLVQTNARIRNINQEQARIHRDIVAYAKKWGVKAMANPAQEKRLLALQGQENKLVAHKQNLLAKERQSVSTQLAAWRRYHPGAKTYTITYQGDTVTVKADGATVQSVMRALNKHNFTRRTKNRRQGQRR